MIEAEKYRQMAITYRRECERKPGGNRLQMVMKIGARVLDLPLDQMKARYGGPADVRSDDRSRLIAFTRLVDQAHPIPLKQVGRAFGRHHSTVVWNVRRFRPEIAAALGGIHESR